MAIKISDHYYEALRAAGIADPHTRRVVIDFPMGKAPVVYIERWGDDKLLSVVQTLNGVEITREAASDG